MSMEKITSAKALRASILQLESQQLEHERLLKEQFALTYTEMKPASIIRRTVKDVFSSADLKDGIFGVALGLVAGHLTKKAAVGATHNPLKQLLGAFLELAVTNVVSKNSDGIGSKVIHLIQDYLNKGKENVEHEE
jgi:hypothetical protein